MEQPSHPQMSLDPPRFDSQLVGNNGYHSDEPRAQNLTYSDFKGRSVNRKDATEEQRPSSTNGQPPRKRISRACDQCNQLRTKCDGTSPCAHCVELGLTCEYARERKKRGKASRKDIAAALANSGGANARTETPELPPLSVMAITNASKDDVQGGPKPADARKSPLSAGVKRRRPTEDEPQTSHLAVQPSMEQHPSGVVSSFSQQQQQQEQQQPPPTQHQQQQQQQPNPQQNQPPTLAHQHQQQMTMHPNLDLPAPRLPSVNLSDRGNPMAMGEYGNIDEYHLSAIHPVAGHSILHSGNSAMGNSMMHGSPIANYGDNGFTMPSPGNFGQGLAGSPDWFSLPSPSANHLGYQTSPTNQSLRYPVLRPLLTHISAIIPISLACDLLDLYFSSTSSAVVRSHSPYIVFGVFRKRSFLRSDSPRVCSPALLASMLWIAAQTSESAFLTSTPSTRRKICQKLLELAVGLLKPLVHRSSESASPSESSHSDGFGLSGFGLALSPHAPDIEGGSPGAAGGLDDVAAYMHLATVVSASEYKAASLRWWNAAWTLARELKLSKELPPNPEPTEQDLAGEMGDADGGLASSGVINGKKASGHSARSDSSVGGNGRTGYVSEEEREERRRIWWLLYIMDRHLSLCYNKPLFLVDAECDDLFQPVDEKTWQTGDYYIRDTQPEVNEYRHRGPHFECTGHSIFGYFLPIMAILGDIIDLNQARNHPRYGRRLQPKDYWDTQIADITHRLEAYGRSLKTFEALHLNPAHLAGPAKKSESATSDKAVDTTATTADTAAPAPAASMVFRSTGPPPVPLTEHDVQTKVVVAYGTHLMHTMHILLNGKWDPIELLDDNDLWISSQNFIIATKHAVDAAEAIDAIIEHDPDISLIPYFFGIYMLQASFLLLLIADKLQTSVSPSVVRACEFVVRGHEACVVTLNTEYQRNFRKVMRSALAQVRGRVPEDHDEPQSRRREVLSLYRWTGDGTGLAL